MELKDLIQALKKDFKIFWGCILAVLILIFGYFAFRPVSFEASLDINITRAGKQETTDYKYDNFYRLQADEKFADTLVEWLGSPSVVSEILKKTQNNQEFTLRQLSRLIRGEKYSSQLVRASYVSSDKESAVNMSRGIENVLRNKIDELNGEQKEENWFKIIIGEPTVKTETFNPWIAALAGVLLGAFIGLWLVVLRRYLKG